MIVAHLKDKQDSETSIGAFSVVQIFLKDYIAKFSISDVDFDPLLKNDKLLTPIDTSLEEIDLLNEGLILKPQIGYIYKRRIFWIRCLSP